MRGRDSIKITIGEFETSSSQLYIKVKKGLDSEVDISEAVLISYTYLPRKRCTERKAADNYDPNQLKTNGFILCYLYSRNKSSLRCSGA